jgi:hypothetical protein
MPYIRWLKVDYMQIKSSDDLAINGKAGTLKPALVERGNEIFIIWYDGDFDLRFKFKKEFLNNIPEEVLESLIGYIQMRFDKFIGREYSDER